jgi:hypothetical protein
MTDLAGKLQAQLEAYVGADKVLLDAMLMQAAVFALRGDQSFWKQLTEHGHGEPVGVIKLLNEDEDEDGREAVAVADEQVTTALARINGAL